MCIALFAQTASLNEVSKALSRGEPERAAAFAMTHLKTRPNDANARVLLARAVLAQGKFQMAYDELRKALSIAPNHIDALYYLGLLAGALSQNEYQQLYTLAPNSDRVHQLLAESFRAQENTAEAEAEYLAALQANPRSVEVLIALGELKRTQSKFDEAIAYYAQAEQIGPLNYDIAFGLGTCYSYKQDHPKALEYFRQAVRYDSNVGAARFALGNTLFQLEQTAAAIAELKAAVTLEPKLRQAYFLLGRAHQKLGNKLEAQAAFKKVDELSQAELDEAKRTQSNQNKPPTKPR
ncbi:MAG TPA: tetratricopeptide repeat protein [Blastocatellia bacterium]|nr:tetratricopeptide repeat protein [Blastocatellia bacterium]